MVATMLLETSRAQRQAALAERVRTLTSEIRQAHPDWPFARVKSELYERLRAEGYTIDGRKERRR